MIKVEKLGPHHYCNSCVRTEAESEILVGGPIHWTSIKLCEKCLVDLQEDLKRKEHCNG